MILAEGREGNTKLVLFFIMQLKPMEHQQTFITLVDLKFDVWLSQELLVRIPS
jgi:hypothetical protein